MTTTDDDGHCGWCGRKIQWSKARKMRVHGVSYSYPRGAEDAVCEYHDCQKHADNMDHRYGKPTLDWNAP